MHVPVSVDSRMQEAEACERALSLGIHEIAFTNHLMLNQANYCMTPQACVNHWEQIQICRKHYPDLGIRLGIEMDYYPGREHDIAATLRSYEELIGRPFDLVLGSIHQLNGVSFANQHHAPARYEGRDLVSVYREYFQVAAQDVRSGLFDIIAHPDLIKKYTHVLTPPLPFADYRDAVEPYLDALLETGVGMELNIKRLKLPVNAAYPSTEIFEIYLSRARAAGVEPMLTLASDAHSVAEVGSLLQEGAAILRSLGVRELAWFDTRKRSAWRL